MEDRFRVTGSSGDVYDVAGAAVSVGYGRAWLHECRDQGGRERLYRAYTLPLTDPDEQDRVGKVAATGRGIVLGAEARSDSSAVTISWPIDAVWRDGALAGVILPAVPGEYLRPDRVPRTLDQLYGPEQPFGAEYRVAAAIQFCELFEALERNDLVHGDIAPHNLLWSGSSAYLLGGEGLRSAHALPVPQPIAEGWRDPRVLFDGIPGHDRYSDRFDVALLVYRCLLLDTELPAIRDGRWCKPAELPSLDPPLRALFDRAFDDASATAQRPTAGEWRAALLAAFREPDGITPRRDALSTLGVRAQPTAGPEWEHLVEASAVPPADTPTPTTGFVASGPSALQPQPISGVRVAGIAAAAIGAVLLVVLGVRATQSSDHSSANSTSTYTPYTYNTTAYSYTPPTSTTPPFNSNTLDAAGTDKTPFLPSALLPQSFRDTKNIQYTLRSSGVMDCITPDMSANVKSILRSYNCTQQVAGSYVDDSNQILVSIDVLAFATTADANRMYQAMMDQTQDWSIWCPHDGVGADVCNKNPGRARRSEYGSQQHRYVYQSTALYMNLSRDPVVDEWIDPPAKAAVQKAGPDNYWHK
ncbi:hypothetical protein ACFXHA_07075 [Nocardia sp. NPDC059240]|uniref:hypothetical protein n=1 Tax=Nocardia sp. NPDC059240 TaxID=3346786 RepID=UPI00368C8574